MLLLYSLYLVLRQPIYNPSLSVLAIFQDRTLVDFSPKIG